MPWLITKYFVTAGVVVLVSELAKRSDKVDRLVAALPGKARLLMVPSGICPSRICCWNTIRQNRLYYASRELGRVVCTQFLLKYVNDAELRKAIHAATNKREEFNDFVKRLFFGGDGITLRKTSNTNSARL